MLERIRVTSELLYWTVIAVIVIAVMTFSGLAIQKYAYPWYLAIQRKSVESSKSFADANNNMLQTYMLEYSRLDTKIAEAQGDKDISAAYESQQKAIVTKMCLEISTMQRDTVNPATLSWLNQKGGCR